MEINVNFDKIEETVDIQLPAEYPGNQLMSGLLYISWW
jgi:hypothetical protein